MPKTEKIVINTSPLIALVAAWGDLGILSSLYEEIFVTFEVTLKVALAIFPLNNYAIP
jgi:hypothetical protein